MELRSKIIIGAVAAGAIIGSAAAMAIIPCCMDSHSKKKFIKYKNHMFKTVGSVLDAVADFKR